MKVETNRDFSITSMLFPFTYNHLLVLVFLECNPILVSTLSFLLIKLKQHLIYSQSKRKLITLRENLELIIV